MAEDVAASPSAPAALAAEKVSSTRAERAHASAYYTRFSVAYTFLIMLGIGGIGALVLILLHLHTPKPARWSTFKPTGSALAMERQIATQVSSEYKESTASKLVTVFPGPLQAPRIAQSATGQPQTVEVPVTLIAVQPDVSTGQHEEGDFTFYHPESTVAYSMCGFGDSQENCGVSTTSGADPKQLFHREALELALYTLKYVPGTDAVVTYLPPPSNPQAAATAVFISRNDVKENLRVPLDRTLQPEEVLLRSGVPNAVNVAQLTRARLYTTQYQTLPADGTAALELTPLNG